MNETYIVFDTETSGAFPVGSEVIELGALKYRWGYSEPIDQLEVLIRPSKPVPEEVIAIHGITNDQLADQPEFAQVVPRLQAFFDADFYVAHHAPFDLGFMAWMWESVGAPLPRGVGICTSLLGRKCIHGVTNHKLQTLIQHYNIRTQGPAHRALADAFACAQVFFKILDILKPTQWQDLQTSQGYVLPWERFSLDALPEILWGPIKAAIVQQKTLSLLYNKGQAQGRLRQITPLGLVRSPLDGDYLSAYCHIDKKRKRFMLSEIKQLQFIDGDKRG